MSADSPSFGISRAFVRTLCQSSTCKALYNLSDLDKAGLPMSIVAIPSDTRNNGKAPELKYGGREWWKWPGRCTTGQ